MSSIDKNQAIIDFLNTCPVIQDNPLYFNFADQNGLENSNHIITNTDKLIKRYIDGSLLKSYTFTIATYKSAAFTAVVNNRSDQNVENMAVAQEILDWIDEQAANQNFPNFGHGYTVESMETLTTDPELDGIAISVEPPIAKYTVGIRLQYVDETNVIWNQ